MTECTTPDGYPYTTSYDTCPAPLTATTAPAPRPVAELPQTGVNVGDVTFIALMLVLCGLLIWWTAKRP